MAEKSEEKKVQQQPCRQGGERTRRGGGAPGAGTEIPLRLPEEPTQEQVYPEGVQPLF